MEIAPLIHSRTLHCDFNPNFAVRTDDVDVNWAMKKILLATSDVDILNGVRRLVASKGKISIAGVACNLRFFAEKYLNDSDADDAKNYFHDERGREVKIFLGYSFKGGNKNEIPDVDYSALWKMFKDTLARVWESPIAETVIVNYEPCKTKNISGGINVQSIGGINFAESNESNDEKIFEICLDARKNLCTNSDQMKIINSGEFEVISTAPSLINRFKSESEKKTSVVQQPQSSKVQESTQQQKFHRQSQTQKQQKKFPTGLIIGAVILIIIAVVFLLIK